MPLLENAMNFDSWNAQPAASSQTRGHTDHDVSDAPQADGRGTLPPGASCASCEPLTTFPSVCVHEDHELVHVRTELPGIGADELDISVDGTTLTLQSRHNKEDSGLFRVGRGLQKFLCRIDLPSAVDHARGEACLDSGVFSLTLPKLVCELPSTVKQDD